MRDFWHQANNTRRPPGSTNSPLQALAYLQERPQAVGIGETKGAQNVNAGGDLRKAETHPREALHLCYMIRPGRCFNGKVVCTTR